MAINFSFSQTGNARYAQVIGTNEPRFLVGKETVYQNTTHGLYNYATPGGVSYNPAAHVAEHGFWAYFIAPTAKAESNNSFICINTYDRAQFTFGFMQYAAHVPNGDFVRFFRELLDRPEAAEYFPKLRLQNRRICYTEPTGALTQLEDDNSTQKLMDYLNPSLAGIESQELICAARFIHWASNVADHRDIQVRSAVDVFRLDLTRHAARYNLNGYPASICQVVCDIHHQGRAKTQQVVDALNTGGNHTQALTRLLQLGQPLYATRITTIRTVINQLTNAGLFNKKYDRATGTFV